MLHKFLLLSLLLFILGFIKPTEEVDANSSNSVCSELKNWEATHLSQHFSKQFYVVKRDGNFVATIHHRVVSFGRTANLDWTEYEFVKEWPNILHLRNDDENEDSDDEKVNLPLLATSKTLPEVLSEEPGTRPTYHLVALFFITPDDQLIHFELEAHGSDIELVNKSSAESYKSWSFQDFRDADIKPKQMEYTFRPCGGFSGYYVKDELLKLFLNIELGGDDEEVFQIKQRKYDTNDENQISNDQKDNVSSDANADLSSDDRSGGSLKSSSDVILFVIFIIFNMN